MAARRDPSEARELLEKLRSYLERHYGISIKSLNRLDRGVYQVDRSDGPAWVARVFPAERSVDQVRGDADVLQFLDKQNFPAERCARPDPVSSPAGRGVLVTEFLTGAVAEPSEPNVRAYGELIGRLNALPAGSGALVREAGALHHYSNSGGGPRNELDAALSWLDEVEDQVPPENRIMHKTLREQVENADDCHDLPKALIHPDPVMKNLFSTPNGLVLIDWTGAGRGPRIVPLSLLIWSSALTENGWSRRVVDEIVAGYRSHIELQEDELSRLANAMRIRPLVFACWRYRYAMRSGKTPNGTEWWWPSEVLVEAISSQAQAAFNK